MAATGTYISDSLIYELFGSDQVTKWATLDTRGFSGNEARLQAAIDWAEANIETRFRGSKWAIPFAVGAAGMKTIRHWMVVYAVMWLRGGRPLDDDQKDYVLELKKAVDDEITECLMGAWTFESGEVDTTTPEVPTGL